MTAPAAWPRRESRQRQHLTGVRLSPAELALVKAEAQHAGCSMAAVLRESFLGAADLRLRIAELESRLADIRAIAESLGDRSKPADYLPPFDPNQPASERPLTDRRLMEPLKRMLLDVLDRP